MGRGAYPFCPRASMPMPAAESTEAVLTPPIDTTMKPTNDAMTWQQHEDFGHLAKPNSRVKWKPLQEAIVTPPAEATAGDRDTWSAQQAEFSAPTPLHKSRDKAATSSQPPHADQAAPAKPSPPDSAHDSNLQKHQNGPRKKFPPKSRKKDKTGSMTALPKTAYVPPHMRKRGSANEAKADSVHGAAAANASPAVSDKSKTCRPAQFHSSPNGVTQSSRSPPSPPTTPQEPEKLDGGGYAGWDEPKPDVPAPTSRKPENPRWPRGPKPAPKKNVWPKSRDMKYIPTDSDSDGDGGVTFKSNSNGDPDYDIKKLLDWNGDWLPPPEQWSARKGYTHRHFGQAMEQWMNGHDTECDKALDIGLPAFRGQKTVNGSEIDCVLVDGVCKELAPRYWMAVQVESKPLQAFWKELPHRAPEAMSDVDITAEAPWWDLYEDAPSCFLTGLVVPEAKIDVTDVQNNINPYGFASANERIQDMMVRNANHHRKILAKRNRSPPEPKFPVPQVEDRRIRPTTNVYFRPVQPADVRGIAEIYNYYVENTIYANEFDGRTEAQIRNRVNDITEQSLPYLVAIAKGNQPFNSQGYISEKIVGYINLDDYCDQSSMYRFTFEMELFVHPGFTKKGIAMCLLDRLLEMANTGYNARGGYEYVNQFEYLKKGPARVIKTILLNVHHGNGEDIKRITDYLNAFKFVRAGRLSKVGYKKDQVVDISIFQHTTTEDIDPRGIPTVPLERN